MNGFLSLMTTLLYIVVQGLSRMLSIFLELDLDYGAIRVWSGLTVSQIHGKKGVSGALL
jgi:hypothetical protein